MKRQGIIYKYTNKKNGKVYIGRTVLKLSVRKLAGYNQYFMRAIAKYGWDGFTEEILATLPEPLLDEAEIRFIEQYEACNPSKGYNVTKGGKDFAISNMKRVIQLDLDGNKIASYNSMTEAGRAVGISPGTIAGVCDKTQPHRKTAAGFRWVFEGDEIEDFVRPASAKRPVEQYDKDGNLLASYGSIADAQKKTGVANPHITKCCKGKLKTTGGFIWKYKE